MPGTPYLQWVPAREVAIGVGLVAGVAALAYYTAQALGIGIAKAVGSATPTA